MAQRLHMLLAVMAVLHLAMQARAASINIDELLEPSNQGMSAL